TWLPIPPREGIRLSPLRYTAHWPLSLLAGVPKSPYHWLAARLPDLGHLRRHPGHFRRHSRHHLPTLRIASIDAGTIAPPAVGLTWTLSPAQYHKSGHKQQKEKQYHGRHQENDQARTVALLWRRRHLPS